MSILTRFDLRAKAADASDLKAFLAKILPDTRAYNGCDGTDFGVAEDAADQVLLIEKWRSKADFEAYLNWRIERGDYDRLGSLLAEAPAVQHFELP